MEEIILGIDPGSHITGYGVIKIAARQHIQHVASGCIRTSPKSSLTNRLHQIYQGIVDVISSHQPHTAAIEAVFMQANPNSAIKLGQARGAAIVAVASGGIAVAEYSARAIKQAVVGYGAAEKQQVQHMIMRLLKLSSMPMADEADALACALCHAHSSKPYEKRV